ncbi:MAG: hypothetical protein HC868_14860 [Sphingomonadales bacterium]|nr:hypothetical protein [Sphingomonadales bacterium]
MAKTERKFRDGAELFAGDTAAGGSRHTYAANHIKVPSPRTIEAANTILAILNSGSRPRRLQ